MNLTLLQDATVEPVTLPEAKQYLELSDADTSRDAMVSALVTAARIIAEAYCFKQFASKQWRLAMDHFPDSCAWQRLAWSDAPSWYPGQIRLPFGVTRNSISLLDPLVSVDAFTWKDSAGAVTPLAANTDYIVDVLKHPGIVTLPIGKSWPGTSLWPSSAVVLDFTAGPSTSGYIVPGTVKQAIGLLINQWFESRIPFEAIRFVAELPYSVSSLLETERLYQF